MPHVYDPTKPNSLNPITGEAIAELADASISTTSRLDRFHVLTGARLTSPMATFRVLDRATSTPTEGVRFSV
jgi:hypothetical protein